MQAPGGEGRERTPLAWAPSRVAQRGRLPPCDPGVHLAARCGRREGEGLPDQPSFLPPRLGDVTELTPLVRVWRDPELVR